jgi:hypothetical protein
MDERAEKNQGKCERAFKIDYVCQAVHIMKTLNVIGVVVAVTIIALAGIAIAAATAAASLLLVQSASATTDVMTFTTTSVGEEQEAVSRTNTTTINNVSNAALGRLFMIVEFETASVNPINETYIETSTMNNVTLMPPNATTGTTINATGAANATINILPNGLALDKGQSLIVTERDDGTAEQENATTTFVDISRMNPDKAKSSYIFPDKVEIVVNESGAQSNNV